MESAAKRWSALLITFTTVLVACQSAVPIAPATDAPIVLGGTVTFGREETVRTFDPHTIPGSRAEYAAIMLTYDRLVHIDASGKAVPELAESWQETPSSVTFKLKQGPTCADGTSVTPKVVEDSLRRFGAPETQGLFKARTLGTAGYDVISDDAARTVTITTKAPFSDLLVGLGMPWASIVCAAGINAPASMQAAPAGSGPFTLANTVAGSSYTFKARPDYTWGPKGMTTKRAGFPQALVMKIGVNETSGANQLLRGELDIQMFSGRERDRFSSSADFTTVDGQTYGADYMVIKQQGIFTDLSVRKALYMALDSAAMNQAMYFGYGKVNPSVVSAILPCYETGLDRVLPFDPAAARKLLDESGWTAGADGKRSKAGQPLFVRVVGSQTFNAAPEYVAEQLKALGFDVRLQVPDFNGWVNVVLRTLDFDVSIITNSGPMPSPNASFSFVTGRSTPQGQNHTHVQRPATEQAVATARTSVGDAACSAWKAAQRSIVENADVKPLYSQSFRWVRKKGIEFDVIGSGVYFDPFTLKSN